MAKVTTRKGDQGYTSLIGGGRVPKYDPRPEAFGTVDEATSALGLARASSREARSREIIHRLQEDLYLLMAELAAPPEKAREYGYRMTAERVTWLEETQEALKDEVEIGNKFIIPGDSVPGAALDLARTVVRRAERLVARLLHDGVIDNAEVLRYLNRVSDLTFVLARYEDARANHE